MSDTKEILAEQTRHNGGRNKASRSVFLSFEFEKDAGIRKNFLHQAGMYSDFVLRDKSLPAAEHDEKWRAYTYRIANFPVGGLDVRNPLRMQMPALRLPILFCIQPSNAWKQWRPGAVPRPKDR